MRKLQINTILKEEQGKDVLLKIQQAQQLIKQLLQKKDEEWHPAQFAEFFRIMAAENLLNFYSTHTPEGYELALERWKNAEEAAQKAHREENFI